MPATFPSERVAIITGASGGLGQALVSEFAALSWRVVAASRQLAAASENSQVWPVVLDVTNQSQAKDLVEQVVSRWQRVDVLVNNAGAIADAPLWQIDDAAWEKVLSVNLKGAFICSQMVLSPMLRQREGHIVNISSLSGRAGAAGQASYAAAKAGLLGLTTSLAREVGSRNIRVNAVLPGILPTRMTSHLDSRQMEDFANANALKRINSLEEVARFIAFLVTTENISGQIFQLDSRIGPWT
jgi:3-oxoacyl-[acyl-carrier protein] reductase